VFAQPDCFDFMIELLFSGTGEIFLLERLEILLENACVKFFETAPENFR
jgi:hypothetical protein